MNRSFHASDIHPSHLDQLIPLSFNFCIILPNQNKLNSSASYIYAEHRVLFRNDQNTFTLTSGASTQPEHQSTQLILLMFTSDPPNHTTCTRSDIPPVTITHFTMITCTPITFPKTITPAAFFNNLLTFPSYSTDLRYSRKPMCVYVCVSFTSGHYVRIKGAKRYIQGFLFIFLVLQFPDWIIWALDVCSTSRVI